MFFFIAWKASTIISSFARKYDRLTYQLGMKKNDIHLCRIFILKLNVLCVCVHACYYRCPCGCVHTACLPTCIMYHGDDRSQW